MNDAKRTTSGLDRVLPTPGLVEIDEIDLALPVEKAWEVVRHADFGELPLVRALFTARTLPDRIGRRDEGPITFRIDDLRSAPERPGFQILVDAPPRELVVGAIGKVWHLSIPFVHVRDESAFAAFDEEGYVKVAWSIRLTPHGADVTRITFELRVDSTDAGSWKRFRRYFALIGPASRLIRRSMLESLAKKHGTPDAVENDRPLPGDDLLPDAPAQITHGITIHARPDEIWPWLVQMGAGRGGFYSIDALDNDGRRSAREVHPELQRIKVGDLLPATTDADEGFEVLAIDPEKCLVLGGLYDVDARKQLPFDAPRPERFWQTTWAFVLDPIDGGTTRLHVRARAAYPANGRLHAAWIRPVHQLMESAQLRRLAARVEGRTPNDDWRDVVEGALGAGVMVAAFLTPFLRDARNVWGLDADVAARTYPGDDLVASPRWSWTHGIEIDAPAAEVWPWVAQLGAGHGGFYSYQWLENVAGCELRNAEAVHPEWALGVGDSLVLHPDAPPLKVVAVEPGRYLVAHGAADEAAKNAGKPWVEVTWTFHVEPLGPDRSRLVSRYRCATSDDLATRLQFGPTLVEPVGFAMDRRMLMGIKERAEAARSARPLRSVARRKSATTRATPRIERR